MILATPAPNDATLVPEDRRMEFLPRLFGHRLLIIGEHTVFSFMERLSPADYGGGIWDFYELAGAPLYMAPTSKPRFQLGKVDVQNPRVQQVAQQLGVRIVDFGEPLGRPWPRSWRTARWRRCCLTTTSRSTARW
ncbi:antirestriction protein [Paracoccus sp. MKU1]|uniref:antirestriction protein n=1 Tax=Paracoccus sp. MKU1 TaxID=1745182 RepID=UPI000ABC5B72|nr:antirestriction protein [Paracoccus sp. MKU1]